MQEEPYQFERPTTEICYNFKSLSQEKTVNKRVTFTSADFQNIYHLALLDVLNDGSTSDITETRNKDMKTVLATVLKIVKDFLDRNSGNIIVFKGSDKRRHRLYRLLLTRELSMIQQGFNVFGIILSQERPELFQADQDYEYYLITKK